MANSKKQAALRRKNKRQSVADLSTVPKPLQLRFLYTLKAYNIKPVNVPPELKVFLSPQQPWQYLDPRFTVMHAWHDHERQHYNSTESITNDFSDFCVRIHTIL